MASWVFLAYNAAMNTKHRNRDTVTHLRALQIPSADKEFLSDFYTFDSHADWQLTFNRGIYTLSRLSIPLSLSIDFRLGNYRHRNRQHGREPLLAAVKINKKLPQSLLDATPGVLKDSFMLAGRGIKITAIERNPLLYIMIKQSLALADSPIDYHFGDAVDLLPSFGAPIIYLDPMYPPKSKSAAVKKDMQVLHAVVGYDTDAAKLLAVARQQNARVVVKRPSYAAALDADGSADFVSQSGKHSNTRFEIYLPKS